MNVGISSELVVVFGVADRLGVALEKAQDHFVFHTVRDVRAQHVVTCVFVVLFGVREFVLQRGRVGLECFFAGDFGQNQTDLRAFVGRITPARAQLLARLFYFRQI